MAAFITHPSVHSPVHQIRLLNSCYCQGTVLDPVVGNSVKDKTLPPKLVTGSLQRSPAGGSTPQAAWLWAWRMHGSMLVVPSSAQHPLNGLSSQHYSFISF